MNEGMRAYNLPLGEPGFRVSHESMNTRSSFLLGAGVALLLVLALAAGWWLASDQGVARPVVTVVERKDVAPRMPAVTSAPNQAGGAGAVLPIDTTSLPRDATKPKLKFEERDLPEGDEVAKFLNGEKDTAVQEKKEK